MQSSSFPHNIVQGLCTVTDLVLSCGVNFFTSLYMHPMEQENTITLIRKKEEAEVDIAINIVSRSIASLDANIALLKESVNTTIGAQQSDYNKFKKELLSTQMQRHIVLPTTCLLTVTECAEYTATCTLYGSVQLDQVVITDDSPVEGTFTCGTQDHSFHLRQQRVSG